MAKGNSISVGNCGEYFVAAELERHGFSVAVPMSNTPLFDLLAMDRDNPSRQIAIQVKTNAGNSENWILSSKNESIDSENIFYVFVNLNNDETPEYYVVPSAVVAKHIKEGHRNWLNMPGKNGTIHKDNSMRKYWLNPNLKPEYRDAWRLLK